MATAFYCHNRSLTNRVTSKPGIFRIQKQIGAGAQKMLVDKLASGKGHPEVKAKGAELDGIVKWVLAQ